MRKDKLLRITSKTHRPAKGTSTDNNTGVQMRAMAEVQCIENEANP